MKKNIVVSIISFLMLSSSFSVLAENNLSEKDLEKIFLTKGSVAFERDYKGKNISINATLRNFCCGDLKKKNTVWFTVASNTGASTCPVVKSESTQYDNIKIGDPVIIEGTINVIDDWSGRIIDEQTGKRVLILHLNKGCRVSQAQ